MRSNGCPQFLMTSRKKISEARVTFRSLAGILRSSYEHLPAPENSQKLPEASRTSAPMSDSRLTEQIYGVVLGRSWATLIRFQDVVVTGLEAPRGDLGDVIPAGAVSSRISRPLLAAEKPDGRQGRSTERSGDARKTLRRLWSGAHAGEK